MNKVVLPPLPERETDGLRSWWTADQLRARDLEVAKLVLEAAAELADAMDYGLGDLPKAIRALEFKHE